MLTKNQKAIIALVLFIIGIIIVIPFAQELAGEHYASERKGELVGTWQNNDESITIIFKNDYTCTGKYLEESYNGTWDIGGIGYIEVDLNWDTPFKIPHPNDSSKNFTIDDAYLRGNLKLYGPFDNPPNLELNKISE